LVESDIGFAAIASKHNLADIDSEMLDQMITKSSERVTHAAIDSKGLNGQRTRIIRLVTAAGLEIIDV
jgi:D-tyrosyl-tRNA(Tyr) deacylase